MTPALSEVLTMANKTATKKSPTKKRATPADRREAAKKFFRDPENTGTYLVSSVMDAGFDALDDGRCDVLQRVIEASDPARTSEGESPSKDLGAGI